jgi:hypothetical protein
MSQFFDIAILGSGPAGLATLNQLQTLAPQKSVLLLELGRPPGKRRRQIEGWMGAVPFSDGKIWKNDAQKVFQRLNNKKAIDLGNIIWTKSQEELKLKVGKENLPTTNMQKKILDLGFQIENNSYLQCKPEQFHYLSKILSQQFENYENLTSKYDTEVKRIEYVNNLFKIFTEKEEFQAEKVLIATGRSGWRWSTELLETLNISHENKIAKLGVFLEFPLSQMRDFNFTSCKLLKNNFEIGPFFWQGTIIPEDHADLILSSFRSNEERWKTEKVAFPVSYSFSVSEKGVQETTRLGQLALLLFNDRVSREKIKIFMKRKSQLNLLPEFNSLHEIFNDLEKLISDFGLRGYLHAPYFPTHAPLFDLDQNCQSEIPGLYFVGESAGVSGILSAVLMGHLAGESLSI